MTKNLLRLILAVFIFYYSLIAAQPIKNVISKFHREAAESAAEQTDIGGMAYTETELAALNELDGINESGEIIIPEPEDFSAPRTLVYTNYRIRRGDMIGVIAKDSGLNQGTLISVNNIKNTRQIFPDEIIQIPNQDGIMYTASEGDTLESISEKFNVEPVVLSAVNELFGTNIHKGDRLFIPGAVMDTTLIQEINGDLFIWPVRGRVTSKFGPRINPVSHIRRFHEGVDISQPIGVPIKAAMAGRVISTGFNNVYGNFVVIAHHSGYRTLYAHLSKIRTKSGAFVKTGETIGNVGNTGQSTGSHLHWSVYKNGRAVNPLLLVKP